MPLYGHLLLFFTLYCVATVAVIARYDGSISALVRFGAYYAEQNPDLVPEGAVVLIGNEEFGGNGYDGQIFYYFAATLFQANEWPEGFSFAYRAPRVGYPLLVAPFSVFGPAATVVGMVVVQILLLGGGIVSLARLLGPERRWYLFFYTLSPFNLVSYLLLVSNSIQVSLCLIGYAIYRRMEQARGASYFRQAVLAFVCFSLAIFSKESALFFLFPLGLEALLDRRLRRIVLLLGILIPPLLWQLYLRESHGMVPARVLGIFLSPLDGVAGVARESVTLIGDLLEQPSAATVLTLAKHSAKILLLVLMFFVVLSVISGRRREFLPERMALLLTLASVLIADYYYFWGIFDNIMRMFTWFVPLMVLLGNRDPGSRTMPFFLVLLLLFVFVFARVLLLTPAFPFAHFERYDGPTYSQHIPRLQGF